MGHIVVMNSESLPRYAVIASEAKQSRMFPRGWCLDCFVASLLAMTEPEQPL
jgi:hypothetical protein